MADGKLVDAFSKALNLVENPPMNGSNPHFKSSYATLPDVQKSVRAACRAAGIAYSQEIERDGDALVMVGYVQGGGERLRLGGMPVSLPPNPQHAGSALTYAKRQLACLHWGIAGEEDDDGNQAAQGPAEARPAAARAPEPPSELKRAEIALKRAAEEHAAAMGMQKSAVFAMIASDKERAGYDGMDGKGRIAWLGAKAEELSSAPEQTEYYEEDVVF